MIAVFMCLWRSVGARCYTAEAPYLTEPYVSWEEGCRYELNAQLVEPFVEEGNIPGLRVVHNVDEVLAKWVTTISPYESLDIDEITCYLAEVHPGGGREVSRIRPAISHTRENTEIMSLATLQEVKYFARGEHHLHPGLFSLEVLCIIDPSALNTPALSYLERIQQRYRDLSPVQIPYKEFEQMVVSSIVQHNYFEIQLPPQNQYLDRSDLSDVLIFFSESNSHLDMHRSLKFQEQVQADNFVQFNFQSVIGENTGPNLVGLVSGLKDLEYMHLAWSPHDRGDFSTYKDLARILKSFGYRTGYTVDRYEGYEYYTKQGGNPIADYNGTWIPYLIASSQLFFSIYRDMALGPQCDEQGGLISSRSAKSTELFIGATAHPTPFYFLSEVDSGSHEMMTNEVQVDTFLRVMRGPHRDRVLENSLVIYLGDHGHRMCSKHLPQQEYGVYFNYNSGAYLEKFHPALYIRLPDKLTRQYPHLQEVLQANTDKLTTTPDLFETIMEIATNSFPKKPDHREYLYPSIISYPSFKLNNLSLLQSSVDFLSGPWLLDESARRSDSRPVAAVEGRVLGRERMTATKQRMPYVLFDTALPPEEGDTLDSSGDGGRGLSGKSPLEEKAVFAAYGGSGISLLRHLSYERDCQHAAVNRGICSCHREGAKVYLGPEHSEALMRFRGVLKKRNFTDELLADAKREGREVLAKALHPHCVDMLMELPDIAMNRYSDYIVEIGMEMCRDDLRQGVLVLAAYVGPSSDGKAGQFTVSVGGRGQIEYQFPVVVEGGQKCALEEEVVSLGKPEFAIEEFLRLDRYGDTAGCNSPDAKLCFCKEEFNVQLNDFQESEFYEM